MTTRILVADDDPVQRRLLDAMIRRFGYEPVTVDGGEAALRLLEGKDGPGIGCVILDLVMPDLDGMGVLGRLKERGIDTPVIVQTAHGSIDAVISAMRAGAVDFVVKPAGAERLQVSLRNALAQSVLAGEVRRLRRVADDALGLEDLASQSPRMQAALKLAEKAAASDIPVLLEGESGVGKELLARAIRGAGNRADKPFVAVNCGAIPENLVESILFGHEKGAFTGASENQIGKFVEADGGTLFLDEIGELPMDAQVKLLRCAAGRPDRRRRFAQIRESQFPPDLRLEPRPRRARALRPLPRRPLLSPAHFPDHRAAAPEPDRGHPRSGAPLRGAFRRRGGQARARGLGRSDPAADRISLARQCASARKRRLPRGGTGRNRRDRRGRVPQIAAQVPGFEVQVPPVAQAGRGRPSRS